MEPRIVRRLVLVVFVGGIAGMLVGSIADNNGTAITFGLITAVAAVCLILVTSVSTDPGSVRFDDDRARAMESRIQDLVDGGADEDAVRDLVRDAVVLGHSARPTRPARPVTSGSPTAGSGTDAPGPAAQ